MNAERAVELHKLTLDAIALIARAATALLSMGRLSYGLVRSNSILTRLVAANREPCFFTHPP